MRIDAISDIERRINGLDAGLRLEARQRLSGSLVQELHDWMHAERGTMSRHNPVTKAIAYMFEKDRWEAFTRFLEDGRICQRKVSLRTPNKRSVAWRSAGNHGFSLAPSAASTMPASCIP